MKKFFLLTLLILSTMSFAFAQNRMKLDDDWMEKIRSEKVAFLTSKLELSPKEAQKFWPVYNEFEEKRFKIHMERRKMEHETLENTDGLSDSELKAISDDFVSLFQKEADLMKEYSHKFFDVLPAKKVVSFYDVENDFRSHMLQEFRKKKRDNNN